MATDKRTPPFTLTGTRYDLTTYPGRVRHFLEAFNPMTLLYTRSDLDRAKMMLDQFEKGTLPATVTHEDLWEARKVKESMVHPDTGEVIPMPFRMSFFLPANLPISAGMVLFGNTVPSQLFWQWMNQSYNAGMNFANRNATVAVSTKEILTSYVSATAVACGAAFGLGLVAKRSARWPIPSAAKTLFQRTVPFIAVASAGSFNAVAMRYKEATDGIEVLDELGHSHGRSVAAGRLALLQVAATRVALPIPVILLPPYMIEMVKAIGPVARAVASVPALGLPLELSILGLCLYFALPCAIALFPQVAEVPASALEPEFQGKLDAQGRPITRFYYNKGL